MPATHLDVCLLLEAHGTEVQHAQDEQTQDGQANRNHARQSQQDKNGCRAVSSPLQRSLVP